MAVEKKPDAELARQTLPPAMLTALGHIFADGSDGDPIPDAQSKHAAVDRIHARLFGRLLDRLSAYTTETGTVLDKGVCAWINDL